jgi:hypothetical protein
MVSELKGLEHINQKVEMYLRQKGLVYEVTPQGVYRIRQGSTLILIQLAQMGEHAVVKLLAPVALNITNISLELTRFLIEKNNELLFGKFSLDAQNKSIWYQHVLLGDFLDVEELFLAVVIVASTADQYDEQISIMAGGKRLVDQ